ncbi:hypothetical protein IR083_01050 [Dysgonomonas sp. GY75]|uniref:hypothetical protein n=1 Tax=Dysgonomonas sp. GY75 TaxID=2780419 RepID=UPI00188434CF|nr:hypothetical protein [Dysgonomonas sp. GY75]MBF0647403.1 hypothetical protein [Dysgonomonas sp. GY75]
MLPSEQIKSLMAPEPKGEEIFSGVPIKSEMPVAGLLNRYRILPFPWADGLL